MGNLSLIQYFKHFIADLGWKMFIWGIDMSESQYFDTIYEQEKYHREKTKQEEDCI